MKKLLILLCIPLLGLLFASDGYAKRDKLSREDRLAKCVDLCNANSCMNLDVLKQCRGLCRGAKKGIEAFASRKSCLAVAKKAQAQAKVAKLEQCARECGWDQCGRDATIAKRDKTKLLLVKQCRQLCRGAKKGTAASAARIDCTKAVRAVKKGTFKPEKPTRPPVLKPRKAEKVQAVEKRVQTRYATPTEYLKKTINKERVIVIGGGNKYGYDHQETHYLVKINQDTRPALLLDITMPSKIPQELARVFDVLVGRRSINLFLLEKRQ